MALFVFLRRFLSVVYLMTHPAVPLRLKIPPVAALLYFLFPRDLFFDFRLFGHVDDFIVVTVLLAIFTTRGWHHVLDADRRKREHHEDAISVDFQVIERSDDEQPQEPSKTDPRLDG